MTFRSEPTGPPATFMTRKAPPTALTTGATSSECSETHWNASPTERMTGSAASKASSRAFAASAAPSAGLDHPVICDTVDHMASPMEDAV